MSDPQIEVDRCVDGCVSAHRKLQAAMSELTDVQVRSPSLLPEWTVGHVLTHLARNADAMTRRIDAALRGETVDQYVGGPAGRAAEIEEGAARAAEALVGDVTSAAARLDVMFASIPDDGWARSVRSGDGSEHLVSMLPFRRWREVEIHLVDLGLGSTPSQWPSVLVEIALPRLTAALADRCDERALMAWALGRGPAPELSPWG